MGCHFQWRGAMVTTPRRLLKKPSKVLHGHIYRTDLACKVTKALQSHPEDIASAGSPRCSGHNQPTGCPPLLPSHRGTTMATITSVMPPPPARSLHHHGDVERLSTILLGSWTPCYRLNAASVVATCTPSHRIKHAASHRTRTVCSLVGHIIYLLNIECSSVPHISHV